MKNECKKRVAQKIKKIALKSVIDKTGKSLPIWMYEEPMPKEVAVWVKEQQKKK